jgi:hypothetical protein
MKVAGGTHRGTAIPRWDWSGVDKLRVPDICGESLENIYQMLPVTRSSPQQLASEISALGARYQRYLYQDEFGPTRAECMAALRETHTRVRLLDSLIADLPQHLALELSYGAAEADQSLSFRVLRSWSILRGSTLEQIHEAASTELGLRSSLHTAGDLGILQEICARAAAAMDAVSRLDTDSGGELFDDALSTSDARFQDRHSPKRVDGMARDQRVVRHPVGRTAGQSSSSNAATAWIAPAVMLQITDGTGAVEELPLELRGNGIPAHKHGRAQIFQNLLFFVGKGTTVVILSPLNRLKGSIRSIRTTRSRRSIRPSPPWPAAPMRSPTRSRRTRARTTSWCGS